MSAAEPGVILLLRTLFGIDTRSVRATPAFDPWLQIVDEPTAGREDIGGLLLLDTRDAQGRLQMERDWVEPGSFQAALILGRARRRIRTPRALWHHLREAGYRRIPGDRLEHILSGHPFHLTRLAFPEDELPSTEFRVVERGEYANGFLLTRKPPFRGSLWDACRDQLGVQDLTVNAFHLRVRGPAVVDATASGRRLILRIVPDPRLHEIVSRNHEAVLEMRHALAADDFLLSLLPRPVFAARFGDTLLLAEEFIPGTLAWRLARGCHASSIRDQALTFLDRLRRATARQVYLDDTVLERLFSADIGQAKSARFLPAPVKQALLDELLQARSSLAGQCLELCASHGDFGYGNVLVDDISGALHGVIDWDTSRLQDLPGMDRINLEVQTLRTLEARSFDEAARHVWNSRAAHDALTGFTSHPAVVRALAGVGICRYVIRLLSYPDVYAQKHAEVSRALEWLRSVAR